MGEHKNYDVHTIRATEKKHKLNSLDKQHVHDNYGTMIHVEDLVRESLGEEGAGFLFPTHPFTPTIPS